MLSQFSGMKILIFQTLMQIYKHTELMYFDVLYKDIYLELM